MAWEVRTPPIPAFQTPAGVVSAMSGRLQDLVPIVAQPEATLIVDAVQPGQVGQPQPARHESRQRLMDRKQMLSISFGPSSTVIETTSYTTFEEFFEVIRRVVGALEAVEAAGVERVGIRYIDEIRVPGLEDPSQWHGYVTDELLVGLSLKGAGITSTQNLAEYVLADPRFRVTMRSGALVGKTVDTSGALRLSRTGDGPYFLLDIDSYWGIAKGDEIPEFSTEEVLSITGELRSPVRTLFEASLTERLRDEVLRKPE